MRKATAVALSPSVANLLAAQRMLDLEEPLVKSKKYPFFKTPRIGSRRIRNRLVQKQGICNISLKNVPKQRRKYFSELRFGNISVNFGVKKNQNNENLASCSDIFTTVIEMKWRWCLLYFSLSFLISWTFFASLYYSIGKHHGDVDNRFNVSWTPCIVNVHSEINAFLFSFTTQTTIGELFKLYRRISAKKENALVPVFLHLSRFFSGYGFRYPTDQCPLTIITMCVQFMWGVMTQVICMRDGKLCLLFRVGDMRKSSLAEAHVRLQTRTFASLSSIFSYDQGLDRIFVIWPITICHEIDEMSPLYDVGEADLKNAKFEIIAILEGVVESVGSTTQARTSYLPSEILWGKRFEKLVHYKKENGQYNIDFCKFHNVYSVKTPSCSAKELDELRMRGQFDESEYQMYPPSDNRNLAIISDDSLSPCQDAIEANQVPQVNSVDLGIHHKCSLRSQSPVMMNALAPPIHKVSCVRRGSQ
ncbi:unnamed protein product [Strongylus vulgaris]|uniref:Inward rectifier potassium channel C-terminal domain-containing protein n=1 Tax=Strongylus vulgaris TaxID=40348 RepID=A0A3P7J471_STRVU|nr:unnamed protein product [Strongylus vulgaris]